jgi:hypothetical protein
LKENYQKKSAQKGGCGGRQSSPARYGLNFLGSRTRGNFPLSIISGKPRLQIHIISFWGWPEVEIIWHYLESELMP